MELSDEKIISLNRMRRLPRYIPALVMISLYALIVLSPLAPLAMRSAVIAHALTGECVGDCAICGCSPERSANHTCCCWQKRQQHAHDDDDQDEPECCKKNHPAPTKSAKINATRPCSGSKSMLLSGMGQIDILPYRFSQGSPLVWETALIAPTPVCRADWPGEPPDPPPKLSRLS